MIAYDLLTLLLWNQGRFREAGAYLTRSVLDQKLDFTLEDIEECKVRIESISL